MAILARLLPLTTLLTLLMIGCAHVPPAKAVALDPATVTRTGYPNDYLVCPSGACVAQADAGSRVYDVPVDRLAAAWRAAVAAEPRTKLVANDPAAGLATWEQRSRFFGFVDTLGVRFIALGEDSSTLAVYSRSNFGRYDFGVNRKRVTGWIAALEGRLGGA